MSTYVEGEPTPNHRFRRVDVGKTESEHLGMSLSGHEDNHPALILVIANHTPTPVDFGTKQGLR